MFDTVICASCMCASLETDNNVCEQHGYGCFDQCIQPNRQSIGHNLHCSPCTMESNTALGHPTCAFDISNVLHPYSSPQSLMTFAGCDFGWDLASLGSLRMLV